jgi:hypothetical protein
VLTASQAGEALGSFAEAVMSTEPEEDDPKPMERKKMPTFKATMWKRIKV